MEHHPTPLLPWLCDRFAPVTESEKKVPDYEVAAKDLIDKTGYQVEPDTLRHVARGYKRPGGPLAAAIQNWTSSAISAAVLINWNYARLPERG